MRLIFLLLLFSGFRSFAAIPLDSTSHKKSIGLIIKADVLSLGINALEHKKLSYQKYYSFAMEKLLSDRHSVQLSYCFAPLNTNFGERKWYMISPEYKFFVSKKKPHTGYYVGGNLKYIHYYEKSSWVAPQSASDTTFYGKYESYSIGAGFINGVQFYVWKRITLDFLAGIGFFTEIKNKQYQPYYLSNDKHYYSLGISPHTDLRFALNIGFKF